MRNGQDEPMASRSTLNAATAILAAEVCGAVEVNSVCPGWVLSDMGGANAERLTDNNLPRQSLEASSPTLGMLVPERFVPKALVSQHEVGGLILRVKLERHLCFMRVGAG